MSTDFPFFQSPFVATLSHWYQDWVEAAVPCFETYMLKCNQRHEACKDFAQSPEPVRPSPAVQKSN